MKVKSYSNQWIIFADERGEIQVSAGSTEKYPLQKLTLRQMEHAGAIEYEGSIEPYSDIRLDLTDLYGRAVYFSIVLNSSGGDEPPFRRITKCKLHQGSSFLACHVDWH